MSSIQPGYLFFTTIFLALASGYLIATTQLKYFLYSLAILLSCGYIAGSVFKIMHLPGGEELLLAGLAGNIFGAVLLIRTGLKNGSGKILKYQLALGIIIILQFIAANLFTQVLTFATVANYLVVALTATLLVRKDYVHGGEMSLLIFFLIWAIIPVIFEFLQLSSY
jgi:hypothetical protein